MDPADERLEFIQEVTNKSFKLKPDQWKKCIAGEENRNILGSFFDEVDSTTLVIYLNAAAQLTVSLTLAFPQNIKSKAVYFIKKEKEVITRDNVKHLFIGDVANYPVDVAVVVTEEVRMPS